jgi:hypothetical protein
MKIYHFAVAKHFIVLTVLSFFSVFLQCGSCQEAETITKAEQDVIRLEKELKTAREKLRLIKASESKEAKSIPPPSQQEPQADSQKHENSLLKLARSYQLSLRYSSTDQTALKKPATLQFVAPEDKQSSYSIDAGLTWGLSDYFETGFSFEDSLWSYSAFAEYHKNSLINKEKDSFLTGGQLQAAIGDIQNGTKAIQIDGRVVYKKDNVSTSDGLIAESMFFPLIGTKDATRPFVPKIGGYWGSQNLILLLQPGLGIQYEAASTVDKTGRSGSTLRGKASIDFAVYPLAQYLRGDSNDVIGPLELVTSYVHWENFERAGGFIGRDHNHALLKASCNYYFGGYDEKLEKRPFAIGIDYVHGDNPEEGFSSQSFYQVGLKLLF